MVMKRYQIYLDSGFFDELKAHNVNKYAKNETEVIRNILMEFRSICIYVTMRVDKPEEKKKV